MMSDCSYAGLFNYVPLKSTGYFSKLVTDYIDDAPSLRTFYNYKPNIEAIGTAIKDRAKFPVDRSKLVSALRAQYEGMTTSAKVTAHIDLLAQDNTFTVTTAHQPNLATGYAYFVYKIMHAVVLAEQLKAAYPEQNFVPVYYMGSEDDDLDELGFFRFNQHAFRWNSEQTGAVGSMATHELKAVFDAFFHVLGPPNEHATFLQNLLTEAYLQHATINEATQYLVNTLFQEYGVVVVNPDDALLKSCFIDTIKKELFTPVAYKLVADQNQLLAINYKTQAYARPINFFYLKGAIRKRIEQSDKDTWVVVDTDINWSKNDLEQEIDTHPEHFSPNVILRGLFQEQILPNVAFIGGGAEVAYWFQLKQIFDRWSLPNERATRRR